MGLDISAHERVILVKSIGVKEYSKDDEAQRMAEENGHTYLCNVPSGLPQADGLPDGIYRTEGRSVGFRAGSYLGYNAWREWLSLTMLGMSPERVWAMTDEERSGLSFVELINFSDCEGFIGPETCAKLARDFAQHKYKIPSGGRNPQERTFSDYTLQKYNEWQEAFALAADKGVVDFH
jgi:hypothetical protein